MNAYNLADLHGDVYFTDDVILDRNFILTNPMLPLTQDLRKILEEWEFETVYSNGSVSVHPEFNVQTDTNDEDPAEYEIFSESIKTARQTIQEKYNKSSAACEQGRMHMVQEIYDKYLKYIRGLFIEYTTKKRISIDNIREDVLQLCLFIKENSNYILRMNVHTVVDHRDFLVSHSLRSTIYAVVIAMQLHMTDQKLLELAIACILHEIGMLRLPPQLYLTEKKLSPKEKQQIAAHPIITYNILKDNGFPLNICLAVLEHHEKENGKGYPRKVDSTNISLYAKIISVACAYEAITSSRSYKEENSTHEAIIEMLKNSGSQYDETVVKALLYTLSIYPIGSYAYLSNGHIAQIVDANPENPKMPIVEIVGKSRPDGKKIRIQTSAAGVRVVRVLNKQEAIDIVKTLQSKADF